MNLILFKTHANGVFNDSKIETLQLQRFALFLCHVM